MLFQRVLHETGLSDLPQAFERPHMEQVFGYDVSSAIRRKKASNASDKELKQEASPQGSRNVEELKKQVA